MFASKATGQHLAARTVPARVSLWSAGVVRKLGGKQLVESLAAIHGRVELAVECGNTPDPEPQSTRGHDEYTSSAGGASFAPKHWRGRSTAHGMRTATEQTPGLESNNRQSLLMLQLRVGEQRSILMLATRHRMGV